MAVEHVILGAGPAGLQMAYFLERAGASYVVLEKSEQVASFFRHYPRQRRLISVNKVHHQPYTHKTRFKYDWNSLLVHEADEDVEVKFKEFSTEYYPPADALVRYLEQFVNTFQLKIEYGVNVTAVEKASEGRAQGESGWIVQAEGGRQWHCKHMYVATGLKPRRLEDLEVKLPRQGQSLYYYDTMPMDPEVYKNKSVMVIGGGNAAYEVANWLLPVADRIDLISTEKQSWKTHFPGHIRSVNMPVIDSFFLKLKTQIQFTGIGLKYNTMWRTKLATGADGADVVVLCLGFVPALDCLRVGEHFVVGEHGFPEVTPWFESTVAPGLHFIGSLTQGHDFKHGSSAFIGGFRFNARFVYQYMFDALERCEWRDWQYVADKWMHQVNNSAALLNRYDEFADYVGVYEWGFVYVAHMPVRMMGEWKRLVGTLGGHKGLVCVVQMLLGYIGENKLDDTFTQITTGERFAYSRDAVFLHPIVRIWSDTGAGMLYDFHFFENGFNIYWHQSLYAAIGRLIEEFRRLGHVDVSLAEEVECFLNYTERGH